MKEPAELFERNRRWAQRLKQEVPELFDRLAAGQSPAYLRIRHVRHVAFEHREVLAELPAEVGSRRLAELNPVAQARNLCRTGIVQDAWAAGRALTVQAWIYGVGDGLLRDLHFSVSGSSEIDSTYRIATETS